MLNLFYAKARMYDAENRRFASVDPVKGQITESMSFVSYLYCVDNPLRWVDPLGQIAFTINGDKPVIEHDKGFQYDPNAVPTLEDSESHLEWSIYSMGAHFAFWRFREAADMYSHYLDNTGTPVEVDYKKAYDEDPSYKRQIDAALEEAKSFTEKHYYDTGKKSFNFASEKIQIFNGEVENWQKTIGAHWAYILASATVTSDKCTGIRFKLIATIGFEDMYNFNPGALDIETKTPDAINGRFAELGWAKEFLTYGSFVKTITWERPPEYLSPLDPCESKEYNSNGRL